MLALVFTACTTPGPRADGNSEVTIGAPAPLSWSGRCLYELQTRWATALRHEYRLGDDNGPHSLVIRSRRSLSAGRTTVPRDDGQEIQGLHMDGATVRGTVRGTLEVTRSGDSTFIRIEGQRTHRDTIPLEAECRLGPRALQPSQPLTAVPR